MLISFPRQCKVARRLSIPTCSRANCSPLSLFLCPSHPYRLHPTTPPSLHLGASALLTFSDGIQMCSAHQPQAMSRVSIVIPRTMMSQGILVLHDPQVIEYPAPHPNPGGHPQVIAAALHVLSPSPHPTPQSHSRQTALKRSSHKILKTRTTAQRPFWAEYWPPHRLPEPRTSFPLRHLGLSISAFTRPSPARQTLFKDLQTPRRAKGPFSCMFPLGIQEPC